jgi:A/G-specific adenine glycosylase
MYHEKQIELFKKHIWDFYAQHGRRFAWRHIQDPYQVMVSEIMLQQTQTERVAKIYPLFLERFPTVSALAHASLRDLLLAWQGLGYNRRAKYLQESAQVIVQQYNGDVPHTPEQLVQLPGIGKATAASICAFAFNAPTVFIETNIRTVYIHFFFPLQDKVHDQEIMPLVAHTVDQANPREWYYALMDFGVFLKKQGANPSRKSVHHVKQSKFEGSNRQIRGKIIKLLAQNHTMHKDELLRYFEQEKDDRVSVILAQLCAEGFLKDLNNVFTLQ